MEVLLNIALVIIGVFFFLLVVLIHEFGHFITAKKFGVKVNEFAIGMGPKIWGKQKKETLYTLRALPIGGFCSMEGEDEASNCEGSFSSKPAWQRMIIVVTGALMNIVLAFILMGVILAGQENFASTTINKFADDSVTSQSGLQIGDEIVSVNGYRTITYRDLSFAIATTKDFKADMNVRRGNENIELKDVRFKAEKDDTGKEYLKKDFFVSKIEKNFGSFFTQVFNEVISVIRVTVKGITGLISGQFTFRDISGPVGIISAVGTVAASGLQIDFLHAVTNIIAIMVVLTVGIGIFNLLPLPALDGGRFVILLFEAVTKKKINPDLEGKIHTVGFILLMLLMAFALFNDISKLFN